ncbi:MAG: hypothetical protein II336_18055 [Loktanella sp.]|nr:hypothetical protein [Loktanella sp.]
MTSKAEARRRKKARAINGATTPARQLEVIRPEQHTARPTPERWARGRWAEATGAGKDARPLVDLAHDMIGRLYLQGQITAAQHDNARTFQELRAGYLQELGAKGFRSCLGGGVGGYDAGDGNVAAVVAYRSMERHIGKAHTSTLIWDLEQIYGQPRDLAKLRAALDAVGA